MNAFAFCSKQPIKLCRSSRDDAEMMEILQLFSIDQQSPHELTQIVMFKLKRSNLFREGKKPDSPAEKAAEAGHSYAKTANYGMSCDENFIIND